MPGAEPDLGALVRAGEGVEGAGKVADGIYVSPGISNAYLLTTSDGDVAVNAGIHFEGARIRERFAPLRSGPLRVLVFTQGHADHIGGSADLVESETQIIAQANYPEVRGYWNRLAPFYGARTQVLWSSVLGGAGQMPPPPPDPAPDLLFQDRHAFDLGGRRFELLATPGGETTDALVVWLPEEGAVFTGNLTGPIFGHLPNLYTIRGDKIRSALRFVDSVDRVLGLDAELLVTGHGDPVRGAEAVRDGLTRIREATLWIHDRTVEGMNAGKDLHTLMAEIALPPELAVGQGHGKTSWCVRAIWEEYAGWFRYESTAELYPVPARAVSPDVVELAGAGALVERARRHLEAGRPVEALHLSDMVLEAGSGDEAALNVRAAALEQLLERAGGENFSEVQWLRGRLAETREALGREDVTT